VHFVSHLDFDCFSLFKEPNNLKNRNSFRLNGLVHPKVVGVQSAADGKGVVFTTGSTKSTHSKLKRQKHTTNTSFSFQKSTNQPNV